MKGTTFFVFLILAVCHFFHPTKMEAAYSSVFYPADSIVQSLMLRRDGEIIKSISVGQQVSIKPFNAARVSGKLSEISSEFLVVDQKKIPIDIIDWIKVRKKSKNPAASFLKGIGIISGNWPVGGCFFCHRLFNFLFWCGRRCCITWWSYYRRPHFSVCQLGIGKKIQVEKV
jgi:hypothetical protein